MRVVRLITVSIVLAGLTLSLAPTAAAKSYRFASVMIDATVHPDGSLDLVERRTYAFVGSFSSADYTVDWPKDLVSDLAISEDGEPVQVLVSGDRRTTAHWTYEAKNERRTWTISYHAACAVRVYEDAAHLLWRFVGRWGVPTNHVEVTIHLPEVAEGVPARPASCPAAGEVPSPIASRPLRVGEARAWGHGPYSGVVAFAAPSTVTLAVSDLRGNQYLEGSVLLPPETIPFEASLARPAYDDILAVEKELADRANEARQRAKEREQRRAERQAAEEAARLAARLRAIEEAQRLHEQAIRLSWWLVAIVLVAGPLLVLLAQKRDHVVGVPPALQEPPEEIHPVQLAMQWSAFKGLHGAKNAYRAQLLHLASEGVIELAAVGTVSDPTDLTIHLVRRPQEEGPDADFVAFLFPGEAQAEHDIPVSSLSATGKRERKLRRWWKNVLGKSAGATERIRAGNSRFETTVAAMLDLGVAVAGLALGLGGSTAAGWLPGIAGLVMLFAVLRLIPPRLSGPDRERFARWIAFRRFLKEFSSLPDAPALAVVIWEHYLVQAVALDVADEVERQVKALVPVEQLPAPWPGGPAGLHAIAWTLVLHAQVPAFAAPSISSGRGFGRGLSTGSGHAGWSAGGFGSHSSGAGFGGGFSGGGGGGFGGGLGGHGGGGTHGGAH